MLKCVFASDVPFTKLLTSRNTLANLKDNSECQTQKRYIFKKFTLISFKFVMPVIRYWCTDTNLIYLKLYKNYAVFLILRLKLIFIKRRKNPM